MKKFYILAAALMAATTAMAEDETVTLDLTKSMTELTFDATNGAWTGTYNDDEATIDSQIFCFIHSSMSDYNTWWGFTASNSADSSYKEDTKTYHFSNMAKGGIVLENGKVKVDQYGAPVTSAEVPYLVAYASAYMAEHPAEFLFSDGLAHELVGCYVNLNSYSYFNLEFGNSFSRAFTNGDKFTLIIHGIADDDSEKTIEVELASYTNGDLTINRGWKYVDLSSLGAVNTVWFSMTSTDTGAYGMNTPAYFCLDKIIAKTATGGVANPVADGTAYLRYDRASSTLTSKGDFTAVYNTQGQMVASTEEQILNLASLENGIYVVRSGNARIKIVK